MPPEPPPTGGKPPTKNKHPHRATPQEKFLWAEGMQESGNHYQDVNQSSGALGRWQVMPANLPGWANQCNLPVKTPEQFLNDDEYQNKLVGCVLGGYFITYGPRGAASMWYSGQPNWHATYGDPPVYQYVDDVIAFYNNAPDNLPANNSSPITNLAPVVLSVFPDPPKPGKESWAISINHADDAFKRGVKGYDSHIRALSKLRIEV